MTHTMLVSHSVNNTAILQAGFRLYGSFRRQRERSGTGWVKRQKADVYVKPLYAKFSDYVERVVQNVLDALEVSEMVELVEYSCSVRLERDGVEVSRVDKARVRPICGDPTALIEFEREAGAEYEAHFEIAPVLRGLTTGTKYVMPVLIAGSDTLYINARIAGVKPN